MQNSDNVELALISILHESGKLAGTIPPHEDLFTELGVKSANSINILRHLRIPSVSQSMTQSLLRRGPSIR